MNEEMEMARNEVEGKIKKIKKHFRDNRKTYITHTIVALAATAVTALILASRRNEINVETGDGDIQTNFIAENQEINYYKQTITKYGNKQGAKGNRVVCLETQKEFQSQSLAAIWAGVSNKRMSQHLDGMTPNVNEWTFMRVSDHEDEDDE